MTYYLAISVLIILVVIAESFAQNYIKESSLSQNKNYLFISVFFYGFVCYFLYTLYRFNNMGPIFLLWSITSSLSVYSLGYLFYGEPISLYDLVGVAFCALGLYLVFAGGHSHKKGIPKSSFYKL